MLYLQVITWLLLSPIPNTFLFYVTKLLYIQTFLFSTGIKYFFRHTNLLPQVQHFFFMSGQCFGNKSNFINPGQAGHTTCLGWPGNASGSLLRSRRKWQEVRESLHRLLRQMDGWWSLKSTLYMCSSNCQSRLSFLFDHLVQINYLTQ